MSQTPRQCLKAAVNSASQTRSAPKQAGFNEAGAVPPPGVGDNGLHPKTTTALQTSSPADLGIGQNRAADPNSQGSVKKLC